MGIKEKSKFPLIFPLLGKHLHNFVSQTCNSKIDIAIQSMLSIDKKMAGVEEVEFSVTEAIENKLETVLKADQNIEASIQAGIAAGTKEVSFLKSPFFVMLVCKKSIQL